MNWGDAEGLGGPNFNNWFVPLVWQYSSFSDRRNEALDRRPETFMCDFSNRCVHPSDYNYRTSDSEPSLQFPVDAYLLIC